jgi:hypothetical protein
MSNHHEMRFNATTVKVKGQIKRNLTLSKQIELRIDIEERQSPSFSGTAATTHHVNVVASGWIAGV